MTEAAPPPLDGRRAQAARNDERILEAARAVFVADPAAPIAAVAERAGVGIGALYRRYGSKEELLRRLCTDGLARYTALAEAAAAAADAPWESFVAFLEAVVEADTVSLIQPLAGTFTPTQELADLSERARAASGAVVRRTQEAGALRLDVELDDVALLLEQLAAVRIGDRARTAQLRRRYLHLALDGLHRTAAAPLPGPPPAQAELDQRWTPRTGG